MRSLCLGNMWTYREGFIGGPSTVGKATVEKKNKTRLHFRNGVMTKKANEELDFELTHGLQVDVDKVEAVVLQSVLRFGREIQVAVALLVA